MMVDKMQLPKIKCQKCGYEWIPRVENPKKCPKCGVLLSKHEGV
jgi:predicted Zn-ribbon and HTH transcriptional regulator